MAKLRKLYTKLIERLEYNANHVVDSRKDFKHDSRLIKKARRKLKRVPDQIQRGYTDYPFTALGDPANLAAPLRRVRILSYDGNKYCEVLVEHVNKEGATLQHYDRIKAGYIYRELSLNQLGKLPNTP
jgi:hypothetical protein